MTVLSRRGAGAVLALGAAAWLSTFVFDRVGTGAGTRVALVSSWQEWVGLTVLAFLVVLLGKAMVERGLEDAGGEKAIPGTLLLPMAALARPDAPLPAVCRRRRPRARCARGARTVVGVGHRRGADRLGHRHPRDRGRAASRAFGDDQAGADRRGRRRDLRHGRLAAAAHAGLSERRRAALSDRHAKPARRSRPRDREQPRAAATTARISRRR